MEPPAGAGDGGAGAVVAPEHAVGKRTREEFLADRVRPGQGPGQDAAKTRVPPTKVCSTLMV
jgi:hypothetical protein